MHPSGACGATFEAVPGLAQFELRTHEAILHSSQGGLPIVAGCSIDRPWADCGLHVWVPCA
eukprot:13731206-Alexandrium_andersonii.AAC.1